MEKFAWNSAADDRNAAPHWFPEETMRRPSRSFNVFSMSALDLFASAMGAFIIISVLLFPYFQLNAPNLAQAAQMERDTIEINRKADAQRAKAEAARRRTDTAELEKEAAEKRRVTAEAETVDLAPEVHAGGVSLENCQVALSKLEVEEFDLVFVFDTTGSMEKPLESLRNNVLGIIRVLQKVVPDLRIGFVAYRDKGEAYLTRTLPLVSVSGRGLDRVFAFINDLAVAGGGDTPEAVDAGLGEAIAMDWRPGVARAIVVIADAPAHDDDIAGVLADAKRFAGASSAKISAIIPPDTPPGFFARLTAAGGGTLIVDMRQIMVAVLLSVIGG